MFNLFGKKPDNSLQDSKTPQKKESLEALWRLLKILMANLDFRDVVDKVVNSLLTELGYLNSGYRIVVLSLVDDKAGGLRRVALSETMEALKAMEVSTIPFEKILIPFSATENLGIKVLKEGKPITTTYWPDILSPPLAPEAALKNQHAAGIKTSMVYPVFAGGKAIGTLIFSMVKAYNDVTEEEKDLLAGFTDLVGLAVQNSKLFTSLQTASEQLQVVNDELQKLDKLKDDFVSVTSHELRTPMTAIRSYAWMALHRADVTLSKTMEKYLVRVLISTERLINLVNDMLNISRIESGRIDIIPEPIDLISLCRDIADEIYYSKGVDKKIQFSLLEQLIPKVFADPGKLRQVFLNIVGNALKFSPPDGKIIIGFFSDGKVVETYIKDEGPGISKEDMSRLFTKFGRLDSSYVSTSTSGGTGLGLYISKSLVELMHGRIWAKSDGQGRGATFTVSLPVASKEVMEEAAKYTVKSKGEVKELEQATI